MVRVETENDIEEASEEMKNLIMNPVTKASKFYSLYYLDRVAGVDGFDFYLFDTATTMRDAFLNYSVYACIGELSNLKKNFMVSGEDLGGLNMKANAGNAEVSGIGDRLTSAEAERARHQMMNIVRTETTRELAEIINNIMFWDIPTNMGQAQKHVTANMRDREVNYNAFSEPEKILKAAEFIFGYQWEDFQFDVMGANGDMVTRHIGIDGWRSAYGGRAWEKVAKTALMVNELSAVPYVDMMWAVEHNNGNFVDKIREVTGEEKETIVEWLAERGKRKGLFIKDKYKHPRVGGVYEAHSFNRSEVRAILPAILDLNEKGSIEPLYNLAKRRYSELRDRRLRAIDIPKKGSIFDLKKIESTLRKPRNY